MSGLPGPRVAIIADDLTGAVDASAPFAARGLVTRVAISPEALPAALRSGADVVSVNTDSRYAQPERAARLVAEATAAIAASGPEFLFKKIDSTLRGNVAAEVAAALGVSGLPGLVCPAVPPQGRSVAGGRVHVDGVPLAAAPWGQMPPGMLAVGSPSKGGGAAAWLCDAENEADLARLVETAEGLWPRWLAVGAAGLAEALAHRFGPARAGSLPRRALQIAFVVGSRTDKAQAQLRCLEGAFSDFTHCHVSGPAAAPDAPYAVIVPAPGVKAPPASVAAWMGQAAARWVLGAQAPGLLLTGGDTAVATLRGLFCDVVEVRGELAPGIGCIGVPLRGDVVPVIAKAGGFGAENLFVHVRHALQTGDVADSLGVGA